MAKILGHNDINTVSGHWFGGVGTPYSHTNDVIESIKDPNTNEAGQMPTAIPSPFARIDLTKNAFRRIANTNLLKAQDSRATADEEKLVSDTLDIAELLFNQDLVQNKLSISYWNKENELAKLSNGSIEHRRIADALKLYLSQDAKVYNFDIFDGMHIIKYNGQVIGGTSPSTLFFSSGNDLSGLQIKLTTNDILFDNLYNPLYNRDPEFQKYFYALFYQATVLHDRMKELHQYLLNSLKFLKNKDAVLANEITIIIDNPSSYTNDYLPMAMANAGDNMCVFKGFEIRKQNGASAAEDINTNSDFRINSSKKINGNTPLVLATGNAYETWKYVKGTWDANTKVPVNNGDIKNRILPDTQIEYPFLGVDDFLEPQIIQLIYPINSEKYFDGNLKTYEDNKDGADKSYLLPLKPAFFDYFNPEDLLSNSFDKPKIEIIKGLNNSVQVFLKIPVVKNRRITFERIYTFDEIQHELPTPDIANDKGCVIEMKFGIAQFPFVRTEIQNISQYNRVQLVDADTTPGIVKSLKYDLHFFEKGTEVKYIAKKERETDKAKYVSQYYVIDKDFDLIQVKTNFATNYIIPKWVEFKNGHKEFDFSVDFGTTNTHIEYRVDKGIPEAFDIKSTESQVATLYKTDAPIRSAFRNISSQLDLEFFPLTIDGEYNFPIRTAICNSINTQNDANTYSLADFNIAFPYFNKDAITGKTNTNLKWSTGTNSQRLIEAYFEEIIIMMRSKVLLNNGNLSATKFIWFYPSSMSPWKISQMKTLWDEYFVKYFQPKTPSYSLAESLAPFYYVKGNGDITGNSKPVTTIDIGGGTTDVVVFQDNKPLTLTSFMFASNTIFGNGYDSKLALNKGLGKKYLKTVNTDPSSIKNKLKLRSQYKNILEELEKGNRSDELNAFLFSLENDKELNFSYNKLLANDNDTKLIFIYFYVAILYHVASIFKVKNYDLPKYLVFSGNGCKLLSIIASNETQLSLIAKDVFEKVTSKSFEKGGVEVKYNKDIPKELTCKGGLISLDEDLKVDIDKIKYTHTCIEKDTISYKEINESIKNQLTSEVETFNNFFIKLTEDLNFKNQFGVPNSATNRFKELINEDLIEHLNNGLAYHKKLDPDYSDSNQINESMFFYAITGSIHVLMDAMCELSIKNEDN